MTRDELELHDVEIVCPGCHRTFTFTWPTSQGITDADILAMCGCRDEPPP